MTQENAGNPAGTTEAAGKPKRQVKKLTIEIHDTDAIFARLPKLNRDEFTKTIVDETKLRSEIRPLVNALYDQGEQLPGVKAYYASDQQAEDPAAAAGPAHNQLA